ncbi:hypothetical protein FH972_014766 [Carpinus fangiana]|uniref:Uncharacterized protein n=1 Tax=Carpinus fangiana TaxID=176857 RepID=A0A5N6RAJ9_9ROSI|nr:hypothetical protein FH972_014766 [Carpinus fangiana]
MTRLPKINDKKNHRIKKGRRAEGRSEESREEMEDGLTRICGEDGTAMAVEAEVGEWREDRRSHAKRWWTGLTRICGGDGTAMAEKRYVADLWKARPICGGSVEEEGWRRRSNKMGW